MPGRCSLTDTSLYAVRHDPEAIYADQAGSPRSSKAMARTPVVPASTAITTAMVG